MLNSDVVLYLSHEIVYVNDPYPYLTVATNNKHLVVYFESFTLFVSALYLIMAQQYRHNLPFFKSDAYKYHQFRIEGGKRANGQTGSRAAMAELHQLQSGGGGAHTR